MNKKKTYILIIAMLLVLAVSAVAGGLLLWSNRTATEQTEGENKLPTVNKKDEDDSKKEQTYKILVKNAEGSPIQGIIAAFYDKAGNVVGEPGTTNNMGAITLKTEETNIASAKVLAVPYEYELNKEFHEFKASKKSVSIVLNENPNAYVAQIGDEVLLFKDAIAKANASETDVTIKLLADVHYAQSFHLNNAKGKTITLDGQGHTLNLYTTSHSIKIYQSTGIVNIQNMKIEHGGLGNLILVGTNDEQTELSTRVVNVNLSNLNIESESTHAYTLINTKRMQTINMNLSKVNLVWKTANEVKGGAIMPGVSGMDQVLNLTLKDSVIDVRQANGARGINAANKVTGEINLINTKILTSNGAKPVSKGKMTLTRDAASYLNDGTPDEAKIGDTIYNKLTEAMEAANKSETDVTITLLNNAKMETHLLFENANGKNIVLDGAGHTLTVVTTSHSMYVHQKTGTVDIKNMKIVQSGEGNVLRIGKKKNTELSEDLVTVNLTNLDIYSSSTHAYTLIHTNESQKIDLNLSKVKLVWDTEKGGIKGGAIMASVSGLKQELNLTLKDCTIDVTKANGAKGIQAENEASGNINLYNTVIKTMKTEAVENDKMVLSIDTATAFHNGTANEVTIGTVTYNTLEEAMLDANTSATDVTITMLRDMEIYESIVINNVNGKNIVLDGAGHEMTAVFNTHTIYVNQKTGAFNLSNMDIVHGGTGCVIRIGDRNATYTEKLTVILNDLGIVSESSCAYGLIQAGYGTMELDLDMTDVDLVWEATAEVQKGAIFAGLSGETTKLNLAMTDCNIDSSNTTGSYGISAESGVTGNLVLNDTTIASNKDSVVDQKMKFTRNTATELSTYPTIQVQVGDVVNNELSEAIEEANNSLEDVTLSFLSDEVTFKENITIKNVNGKNITIDGNNKKLVSNKVIFIYQENGTVEVKDLTVKHSSGNPLFRIGEKGKTHSEQLTVNLKNLDINSTSTRKTGIIEAGFASTELDLNMIDVDLTWETDTTVEKGAILIGTSGVESTVNLTMTNCSIDTSDVAGAYGISAESGVTGNLVLNDTAITSNKNSVVDQKMKFTRNTATELSTYPTTQVQVNDVVYNELSEAIADVNKAEEDVTITLLSDIGINQNLTLQNENEKNIVLNGKGHTATVTAPILIYQEKGLVEVKNLVVNHTKNILFRIGNKNTTYSEKLTVNLKNLDITSTSNQSKGLIQAGFAAMELDVNMTGVDLVWKPTDTHAKGAITAGNADITANTTLNLTMTDCNIDASEAADGYGVYVESAVTGKLVLNNTKITSNQDSVFDQKMKFTRNAATELSIYPTTQIRVGDVVYNELSEAIADANNSQEDVTITLLSDISISSNLILKNVNNKNIVLDGNGHIATVTAPILISQHKGTVEVKDLNVNHTKNILFRIGEKGTDYSKKLTVNLKNLDITSSSTQVDNGLIQAGPTNMELDVNMTDVNLVWTSTVAINKGAIVAGLSGKTTVLSLTMTDSIFDVTGADGAKAIYAESGVAGTLTFKTTTVKTKDAEAIKNSGRMTLNIDIASRFYHGETQSVALIDGVQYSKFTDAVTVLNGKTENVAMDIVGNVSISANLTVKNENGKNIVLDGNGHTATVTAPILISQHQGTVEVKDLVVNHTKNILLRIGDKDKTYTEKLTVNLNNLEIISSSTQTDNGLIQAGYTNMNLDLNMTNVDLIWTSTVAINKGAIVAGRSGKSTTLNLVIKDCEFDVTGAAGAKVIYATDGVTGAIKLNNTTIDDSLVSKNKMTLNRE